MIKNIVNLGDAAIYCDFGSDVNKEINSKVIKYFMALKEKNIKGITNLSPSYNKLIISFDLNETNYEDLKKVILDLKLNVKIENRFQKINIPICCDDEFSIDIERIEEKFQKSKSEIINLFLNKNYFCYMTGFIAGMPFLGDIDEKIQLDRLETPRVKVPKGSVGLTGQFCNIYTFESPGGWNIIGKTPLEIFNSTNVKKPNLISPGDQVTFYEIKKEEYEKFYEK
tara:strand:+ start:536 stop:1213 length:678 start_codon:yes stop_codon:yes gene_type:complete